ncbi:MAG: hypothetical protein WCF16_02070 [Alphaproteobacteria bacterium]
MATALTLGGCSVFEDVGDLVWPSSDEPQPEVTQVPAPQPPAQQPQQAVPPGYPPVAGAPPPAGAYPVPPGYPAAPGAPPPPPPLGTTTFQPTPPTPISPTGTYVGGKVVQLRQDLVNMQAAITAHNTELQQLRNQTVQHSQAYWGTVAAVSARLQVGTTPGNPVLVQQWNEAQAQLDRINSDVAAMNGLANKVAADSAMSSFLLESTRAAYGLSGAVDEDHRQLAILEDEVNKTVVLIDRLLNELNEDIRRQTDYVARERDNLTTLALAIKNGELYGTSLANRAFRSAAPAPGGRDFGSAAMAPGMGDSRRPLVVIRFDRPKVDYEQALYSAVSRALERRPDATFELVAVTAQKGSPAQAAINANAARRNAERVLRSLNNMGLPAERVTLSATTSTTATGNEVLLYVR